MTYTKKQLLRMTLAELVGLYNYDTANKVTGFATKVAAVDAIMARAAPARPRGQKARRRARPERGIGRLVKECLRGGAGTDEALDAVRRKFPKAKTTARNVAFYRCQLRRAGELPKA